MVATVIQDLASQPTHMSKLVQGMLDYAGYCNAMAFGAGGIWFGGQVLLSSIV
jgi:hypothetical protein